MRNRSRSSLYLQVSVAALLLAVMGMLSMAAPVAAKTPKPPKYAGAAPGSVSCSLSAKVSFSPALTDSGGGTRPSTVKGTLSRCRTAETGVTVTITKGTVTGSFASSPLSCVTKSTTGAPVSLTIKWKGSVNGTVGSTTYAGSAKFTSSTVSGDSAIGSFSGGASVGVVAPSNLATLCSAEKGVKVAPVTGTVTVGFATAYVANSGSSTVTPIDTATNTAGTPIPVVDGAAAVAVTPNGATAYVANTAGDTVTPIDTATNTARTPIAVGDGPKAVAITPNGATVYVTNALGNTVTPIDTATNTAGTPIKVGAHPCAVAITPNGATVYVANRDGDTVTPIDTATNTAGTPINVGNGPDGIAITPNGTTAYVTNVDGSTITPIAIATNTAGTPINVGNGPDAVAITPNGTAAYVANYSSGTVTPIAIATNTAGTSIPVGSGPGGIAIS